MNTSDMNTAEMIKFVKENPDIRIYAKPYSNSNGYNFVEFVNSILCWGGNIKYPLQISTTDIRWYVKDSNFNPFKDYSNKDLIKELQNRPDVKVIHTYGIGSVDEEIYTMVIKS